MSDKVKDAKEMLLFLFEGDTEVIEEPIKPKNGKTLLIIVAATIAITATLVSILSYLI